ncbi:Protein Star [Orchesella cincta]|uniref:Protein Star n=1 Tax=Orchesella cincta TaxID=48709 RepID=A0A1D2MIQ1_ORCCI|nr:Protein Star [Orchesella cincta]
MGKEVVKHTSMRSKFCIAALFIAILIYMFRLYPTTEIERISEIGKQVPGQRSNKVVPTSKAPRVSSSHDVVSKVRASVTDVPVSKIRAAYDSRLSDRLSKTIDKPFVIRNVFNRNTQYSNDPIPVDIQYIEDNFLLLNQKDSQLIQYTRIRHLTPPSKLKYNLRGNTHTNVVSDWVASFFKNKTGGKFLEAGASQGENGSNTLYLEKDLGWTGLLVECNPLVVPYLRNKHRKAWIADVCLSPSSHPTMLNITKLTNGESFFQVQAVPLYTILAALEWKEIDYFNFNIGGNELSVLKYFPFHRVKFKVISVEVYYYPDADRENLNNLLLSREYIFVKEISSEQSFIKFYIHNSVKAFMIDDEVSKPDVT